LIIDENDNNIL